MGVASAFRHPTLPGPHSIAAAGRPPDPFPPKPPLKNDMGQRAKISTTRTKKIFLNTRKTATHAKNTKI